LLYKTTHLICMYAGAGRRESMRFELYSVWNYYEKQETSLDNTFYIFIIIYIIVFRCTKLPRLTRSRVRAHPRDHNATAAARWQIVIDADAADARAYNTFYNNNTRTDIITIIRPRVYTYILYYNMSTRARCTHRV